MVDELNITRKSPYNKTFEDFGEICLVYDLRNSLVKGWLDISHRMKFLVDFALFEFFLV